jgi:hypothetical protein
MSEEFADQGGIDWALMAPGRAGKMVDTEALDKSAADPHAGQ